jgi:starch synthase
MIDRALKILFVTSEVSPFSKTGGLADVSAALPRALASAGCDVRVLSPRYGVVNRRRFHLVPSSRWQELAVDIRGRQVRVSISTTGTVPGQPEMLFVECDALYERPGLYVDPFTNHDYIDNDYRYILLSRVALLLAERDDWTPDILHCNDWQTALACFYLAQRRAQSELLDVRSLLTIHNIAYHGSFGSETVARIGDAESYYYPGGPFEFYGRVNFLKGGLEFADALNTVSPTYAHEVQSTAEYSYGLDAVLRLRDGDLRGILNGIDTTVWNPAADRFLPVKYGADSLTSKDINKRALCERMNLPFAEDELLIGMVSRIAPQKGFDILIPALGDLLGIPCRIIMLASGDPHFEHVLRECERIFADRFRVFIGYDEELAHLIEAGADVFLMPSKYEPCGLNQMMSMRYGTLPVVRATGGLADTVVDADADPLRGTGFAFTDYRAEELTRAVRRAAAAFQDRQRWQKLQRNAMARDFSWNRSAIAYRELYEECLSKPPRPLP